MRHDNMEYTFEIAADGSLIIDGKIHLDGTVTGAQIFELLNEYNSLNGCDTVYTPVAMEKFLNLHGLLVGHFVRKDGPNVVPVGTTMAINGNRITKVSKHFLSLKKDGQNEIKKESCEDKKETTPKGKFFQMKTSLKAAV